MSKITIVGGGLAGCEAAWQIAKRGHEVRMYEMRPVTMTPAHKTEHLAELVCSNSFRAANIENAVGLLKEEMRRLDSLIMEAADATQVPAGGCLAVDRNAFSAMIEKKLMDTGKVEIIREEIKEIPDDDVVIIATGPLTAESLAEKLAELAGRDDLYFYDAVAPIISSESINMDIAFYASRYDKGEASYINCPMNKEQYEKFYNILINAPRIEQHDFEKGAKFFESCLPIEVLASRGEDTLRFGPMKPVGLVDKRTNEKNYAVVQLRQDNSAKTLFNLVGFQTNLKWGSQKELLQSIPGLENVNIVRYGVMHRNTFINSPSLLKPTLQTRARKDLFFAGQITGTEGYTESIASGLLAGMNMARLLNNEPLLELPKDTMLGALTHYITNPEHTNFQPINSNWGIVPPVELPKKERKNKKLKGQLMANRAIESLKTCKISLLPLNLL